MGTNGYNVERTLNNNVLIVHAGDGREEILIGKGIGFGMKPGASISLDDSRIEKRFALVSEENQERFRKLHAFVRPEIVGAAEEIIAKTAEELGVPLHEHIHVALPDHIQFALTRLSGGLEIENPFLEEIRTLYARAWGLAEAAAKLIEQRFSVPIPPSEVGFLALHIHAATHGAGLSETVKVTDAVNAAVNMLERITGKAVSSDSLDYARLVTHLRFAIQRVLKGEAIVNPMARAIQERLPRSFEFANAVTQTLEERLRRSFPQDEISYLALHVARLTGERDAVYGSDEKGKS